MYYPLMVDLRDRDILIVGGGSIAYRKAKALVDYGPKIRLVSPDFHEDFFHLRKKHENLELIEEKFASKYLENAYLVFAATNSKDLNEEIVKLCKRQNILCNNISNGKSSSFISPSVIGNDSFVIATSTMGKFPYLSKQIKRDLDKKYSKYTVEYMEVLEELRKIVLQGNRENLEDIFSKAIDLDIEDLKELVNKEKYKDGGRIMKIVVGTRGSKLAVTQTNMLLDMIKEKNPQVEFEVKIIKTKGDLILDKPIDQIGGKEIFIKEIEKELLDGTIDLAIHSMKDMPGELPKGLRLSHIPKREDHRDVMVLRKGLTSLEDLGEGAKIGTGSKRRKFQILNYREDLEVVGIRGNIETRIGKIESENLDGVILAAAGINRLGLKLENVVVPLEEDLLLSSPCQGILGIEIREDDDKLHSLIESISDPLTEIQAEVERDFLRGTGGSCHVPVGAYCKLDGDNILLDGVLGTEDGEILIRKSIEGSIEDKDKLGLELARLLTEEIDRYER